MNDFYVINDIHIGAIRSGGTTGKSAYALRHYILERFKALLQQADGDLLINGDLFDTYSIPYMDLLQAYLELVKWQVKGHHLHLIPGNHDLSKTIGTMSSFQFLCRLFDNDPKVSVHDASGPIDVAGSQGWIIPHVPNQDLFNLELEKVPAVKYLFLHCNYDNHFAVASDHSLNVSPEQAGTLQVERIIFGHEHQFREALDGKVLVVGNQIPSSVADCSGNDVKFMLRIEPEAVILDQVWTAEDEFLRIDWRNAMQADPMKKFIRIEGACAEHEAAAMISAIAKLRQTSDAFVITNAVKIEGAAGAADTNRLSLEEIKGFDVLQALMKKLTPGQQVVVKALMEGITVME